ncbi:unnamed protein product [Cuscuta epithymum]|uniref:Replication factor A C-terminal domain-containing protein n=2 Tax=Cuscuta epithymum TaxID=186058 RepID=A0AAV0DPC1_9ASTE|nr:unnamed protein product [Cuscuta epithymum]
MAGMWSLINDFDQSKTSWTFKARAVRVYEIPAYGIHGESLQCIFHDREGTKIHAHVGKYQVAKFRSLFKEGHVYAIRHVLVQNNYMNFKTTRNAFKLLFINKTEAFQITNINFPMKMFDFTTIAALQAMEVVDETHAIDVIGKVTSLSNPKALTKNGRETQLIDLTLGDALGNTISCTLWEELVDQLMDFLKTKPKSIILILQLCRPRKYQGRVGVTNMFNVTKMLLNRDCEECAEFKATFGPDNDDDGDGLALGTFVTPTFPDDLESGNVKMVSIDDLMKTKEDGKHWVYGEILAIDSYRDWYYISCKGCSRKVLPEGDTFRCVVCNTTEVILRYKVNMRVMDDTGHASFVFWDKECSVLVGKPANALRDEIEERGVGPYYFPVEIDCLVGIKGLFRVQSKREIISYRGVPTFSVIGMNCDPNVMSLYENKGKAVEEEDDFTLLKKEFSVPEEIIPLNVEETSLLLTKEKRKAVAVNYDGIKKRLFVEGRPDERPPVECPSVEPMKKLKKVKVEK